MKAKTTVVRNSVIILGGSFSPFHDGHALICRALLTRNSRNIVIIVPSYQKYNANTNEVLADTTDRLKIIALMKVAYRLSNVQVSKYEIKRAQLTPTILTLDHFSRKYPHKKIYFAIGDDLLKNNIEHWEDFSKFNQKNQFIIFSRSSKSQKTIHSEQVEKFISTSVCYQNKLYPFSATEFRNGVNLEKYHPKLNQYVNSTALYWKDRLKHRISTDRVTHSYNVAKLAVYYGRKYGVNQRNLFFAGIYHDLFKNISECTEAEQKQMLSPCVRQFNRRTWHGFICAYVLKHKWKVRNPSILAAIAHHTVPTIVATMFEKIIYCADKLSYERQDKSYLLSMRALAKTDLKLAFRKILYAECVMLLEQDQDVSLKYLAKLANAYFTPTESKKINELISEKTLSVY